MLRDTTNVQGGERLSLEDRGGLLPASWRSGRIHRCAGERDGLTGDISHLRGGHDMDVGPILYILIIILVILAIVYLFQRMR